uniref:Kinesin motor domain-containing protein n=1 Tax=Macrostomum lignano TaxID=282301 RepID=A0A1I8IW60_9PLAT
ISRLCNGNLTSRIMSVPAALRTDGRSGLRHRSLVELQSLKLILEATSSAGHCKQSKRAAGAVGISLLSAQTTGRLHRASVPFGGGRGPGSLTRANAPPIPQKTSSSGAISGAGFGWQAGSTHSSSRMLPDR